MLHLLFVGKSEDPFRDLERYYTLRVKSFRVLKVSELKEPKDKGAYAHTYITSPKGREIDEDEFIELVRKAYVENISIIVGGPFGVPENVEGERISFSKLTFSHGLFRVMLLEQVYRALLTIKGSDYRK